MTSAKDAHGRVTSAKDARGRVTSAKDAHGRVTSAKDAHECVSPGAEGYMKFYLINRDLNLLFGEGNGTPLQ